MSFRETLAKENPAKENLAGKPGAPRKAPARANQRQDCLSRHRQAKRQFAGTFARRPLPLLTGPLRSANVARVSL